LSKDKASSSMGLPSLSSLSDHSMLNWAKSTITLPWSVNQALRVPCIQFLFLLLKLSNDHQAFMCCPSPYQSHVFISFHIILVSLSSLLLIQRSCHAACSSRSVVHLHGYLPHALTTPPSFSLDFPPGMPCLCSRDPPPPPEMVTLVEETKITCTFHRVHIVKFKDIKTSTLAGNSHSSRSY